MGDIPFKKSVLYFSMVLLLLEVIVYRDFIFGNNCLLFKDIASDSYNAFYPDLVYKVDCLKNGQLPGWQFHTGLGQNNYAFWLEPISLGIAYFFFKNDVASSIIWIQLTFTFLAGFFLFLFFRKNNIHFIPAGIGAVLYAFSGYMVAGSTWAVTLFSNEVMLLAFLLLSLTYFFKKQYLFLFPIALALIGISFTPVLLYFSFIVILVFGGLHISSFRDFKAEMVLWIRFLTYGALGIGISCYLLISNVYQLLQSPRGSGLPAIGKTFSGEGIHVADSQLLNTTVLRLFSNNLQGVADTYHGWKNYLEAPFLYSGLIVLLLIPQLFHFLKRRYKIVAGILVGIFVLIGLFPFFRHAAWLFTGDYFRTWSLLFVLGSVIAATFALQFIISTHQLYLKTLFITLGIILLVIFGFRKGISSDASLLPICFLLIAYTGLFYFWQRNAFKNRILYSVFGLILLELIVTSNPTLTERKIVIVERDITQGGFGDPTIQLVQKLKANDPSFYRIEKDYFSGKGMFFSYNEAFIQNFNGSASYFSFHNANYIRFLKSMGAIYMEGEAGTRFVKGIREIPEAMNLCSVKYLISNQESIQKYASFATPIAENSAFTVLKMNNRPSFGFTYNQFMTESDFEKLSIPERRRNLMHAIVVPNQISSKLRDLQQTKTLVDSTVIQHTSLKIKHFQTNEIDGTIDVEQPAILFFSIPYDCGWSLKVDGEETEKIQVFHGLTGGKIATGKHTIQLTYDPPFKKLGECIAICSLLLLTLIEIFTFRKRMKQSI